VIGAPARARSRSPRPKDVVGRHRGQDGFRLLPADSEQVEGLDRSPAHEQVTRVARRIAAATERNDYQWEFKVLDDPQVNAFCLPGGNVAVYPGLFPMARDDVGLAAVLG
jgi:metalloendopeptidase OMA1, mitochondrial